jgi:hypothetical protein
MLSGHLCVKISAAVRHSKNVPRAQSVPSAATLSGHLCVKISAAVRHSRNGRGAQSAQSAAADLLRALLPALIRFFCRGKNELVVHSGVRFSECSHVLNPWRCHWFGGMLWV